LYYVIYVKID
jgi:hypothetical protein